MNEEWIKENYDKVAMIVATVLAVAIAGWLLFSSLSFSEMFVANPVKQSDKMPDTGIEDIQTATASLSSPVTWDGEHLFVSGPVLEVDGELVPINPETVLHPPIKNEWIAEHELDITDSRLRERDPDGDGFSNVEEYAGKTDPNNADSIPPYITKVCLDSLVSSDLKLTFQGSVDGGRTYQIDLNSAAKFRRGQFVKRKAAKFGPNDMFKVESYKESIVKDANGIPVDSSELLISYIEAGGSARVNQRLIAGQEWEMPTHTGNFINRFNNETFEVERGKTFTLSNDSSKTFRLIAVTAEKADIKDQSGNELEITPCK